jgi:DNA-binding NarL/FixJ family response regulator
MQGKRRRKPAPPATAARVAESPETTASAPVAGSSGVRYDPDELFPDSKRLSVREREALELLADGKPNGVIASVMKNSKRTVENHISKVLSKLNVADRNEAMALYHQAIEAKLERENAQLLAQIRALEEQNAALRRQLRRT